MLVAGLVASQSRGASVAALLTVLVAFVVFKRRRIHVAAFTLLAVGAAIMLFSTTPGAWERVTNFNAGGSGRNTLWTGAWRAAKDYPVAGAGLNNFRSVAPDYAREPGALEQVHILAEQPRYVHNTYLQLLAENGVIGLLLYLGFALGCLRAALLAARRFEAARRHLAGDARPGCAGRRDQHADRGVLPLGRRRRANVGPLCPRTRAAGNREPTSRNGSNARALS